MLTGAATFFILCLLTKFFIVDGGIIEGPSMEPTFTSGSYFIINKTAFYFAPPKRGDIVQIIRDNRLIIKRIIGVPGDVITIKQGAVWVNGIRLPEPYLPPFTDTSLLGQHGEKDYTLHAKEYFVLGDNRIQSSDSRIFGPILRSTIIGKIIKL